jgi:hypothetical protein
MKVADSQEQLDYLEKNPKKYLEYRKQIENELNQRFKFIIKGSDEAVAAREHAENEMRTKLNNDARLTDKMIPKNFNPGCRRPSKRALFPSRRISCLHGDVTILLFITP